MPSRGVQLYARDEGTPLRVARGQRVWTQSELARRAETSSGTISQLEGIVGRAVSDVLAGRIADALDLPRTDLFTTRRPPAERIGERSRPAARLQDRYSGEHAKAEAAQWQCYLDRVRNSDVEIYEWGSPLSAERASARFGLNSHSLAAAAREGRVRSPLMPSGRNAVPFQFNEEELAQDLAGLRCCFGDCDRVALGTSGGCEEHGHVVVWTGAVQTLDARARISAGKRGKARPDTALRMKQDAATHPSQG